MQTSRSTRRHGPVRAVAAAAALALLLMACGGGDTGTGDAVADPTAGPTSEATTPGAEPTTAACDQPGTCEPSEELIAAAKAEGEVTLYSSVALVLQEALAAAFKDKYGITVNFAQIGDPDQIQKVTAEVESGRVEADVSQHTTTAAYADLSSKGAFAQLLAEELPNLAAIIDDDTQYRETFAYWGGVGYVMAWNDELVSDDEVPETWCELADPAYSGRLGAVDVQGSISVYAHYQAMEDVCGDDFLEQIRENGISYYPNITSLNPAVAAGEVEIAMHAMPHVTNPLIAEGAPISWKIMDGMGVAARFFGVLADAPHPNAARLFGNFLLSAEAQQIAFSNEQGLTVLPSEVPDAIQLPETWVFADSERLPADFESGIRTQLGLE